MMSAANQRSETAEIRTPVRANVPVYLEGRVQTQPGPPTTSSSGLLTPVPLMKGFFSPVNHQAERLCAVIAMTML